MKGWRNEKLIKWEYLMSIIVVVCASTALIAGCISSKDFITIIIAILSFHGGSLLSQYKLMHFKTNQKETYENQKSPKLKQLTLKQTLRHRNRKPRTRKQKQTTLPTNH